MQVYTVERREQEWLKAEEERFEKLTRGLNGVLQTTRKRDPTGRLQVLEVRIVLVPPWHNKHKTQ